jgi:hypothetical protein
MVIRWPVHPGILGFYFCGAGEEEWAQDLMHGEQVLYSELHCQPSSELFKLYLNHAKSQGCKEFKTGLSRVVHTCNPSYSGGGDGSKSA